MLSGVGVSSDFMGGVFVYTFLYVQFSQILQCRFTASGSNSWQEVAYLLDNRYSVLGWGHDESIR